MEDPLKEALEYGLSPSPCSTHATTEIECDDFSIWLIRTLLLREFKCQMCSRCCDRHFFTVVPLFEIDVKRIVSNTDWTLNQLEDAGEYETVNKQKILNLPQPCIFLLNNKCSIYGIRPTVCHGFPLALNNTAQPGSLVINISCPGGNKLYSDLIKTEGYDAKGRLAKHFAMIEEKRGNGN